MTKFEKFIELFENCDLTEVDGNPTFAGYAYDDGTGMNLQFEDNDIDITKKEIEGALEISPSKFSIFIGLNKVPYIIAFYQKSPYILPND